MRTGGCLVLLLLLLVLWAVVCESSDGLIPLPPARTKGPRSLEEVLAARRSVRAFSSAELTGAEIAQLLWAAQGVTSPRGYRTAPSAGGLYPLEIYVATRRGVTRYQPRHHRLETRATHDVRGALYRAALSQEAVRSAPALFVITGVVARTSRKYGVRAERYVHLEAGHAAQNLLLQATALRLGATPIGAFSDEGVGRALGCASGETPLYVIPVGRPAGR